MLTFLFTSYEMAVNSPAYEALSAKGELAQHLVSFSPRDVQQKMAIAVEEALEHYEKLVIEAGTGTGKTYAYLVPAFLSGKKVIISTGTKNLQEQLFHRDLPIVRQALRQPLKVALLKGRANYLCLQRLDTHYQSGLFKSRQIIKELQLVKNWSSRTSTGDIAELTSLTEDSAVWSYATSTADNCLGQECPQIGDCFLLQARRAALEADILIINHHLFFADVALRDTGFGELLPGSSAIIFDEAHQLAEVASNFFGETLSSRQITELVRDVLVEQIHEAPDMLQLREFAERVDQATQEMRAAFGLSDQKSAWSHILHKPTLKSAVVNLENKLAHLQALLKEASERSKSLASCLDRTIALLNKLVLLTGATSDQQIHWYETQDRAFKIHLTPLTVAENFRTLLKSQKRAWIFTSATLTVDDHFHHYVTTLGLEDAKTLQLKSPFDYPNQGLLYIPTELSYPQADSYTREIVTAAIPVLRASEGRAFFLFTSYRALQEAADLLATLIDYPLLVQGAMPKNALLNSFCQIPNAVLLGTSSFWEGVDVRGDALSCVIIDKLPFASPDDPILKARAAALKKQGIDPFLEYQLPQAVVALKQGAGRLIRDDLDKGILMIGDPRLLTKGYGKVFLKSLPPMPITHQISDVQHFFAKINTEATIE